MVDLAYLLKSQALHFTYLSISNSRVEIDHTLMTISSNLVDFTDFFTRNVDQFTVDFSPSLLIEECAPKTRKLSHSHMSELNIFLHIAHLTFSQYFQPRFSAIILYKII